MLHTPSNVILFLILLHAMLHIQSKVSLLEYFWLGCVGRHDCAVARLAAQRDRCHPLRRPQLQRVRNFEGRGFETLR